MKVQENNWKTLSGKQKLVYFRDYYLVKALCILAAIAMIGYLCFSILHKDQTILYVACIDDVLDEQAVKELEERLKEELGNEDKHALVMVDDSFYTSEDGIHKLEVYLSGRQVDLIVAAEDTYKQLAAYGFMQDLNQVMDAKELEINKAKLMYTAGYKDSDEISFEDQETGKGDILPYGIKIKDSTQYKEVAGTLKNPVIGCTSNTKQNENAKKILETMLNDSKTK
ncbi:MAG: hypothetical protein Q4G58_16430 [bacterium]|nr:hypothetical protein [bacterium]